MESYDLSKIGVFKMKFKILELEYEGKRFRIEEDYLEVGSYLYVYDGEKCIKDHLQDNIEKCKKLAFEEYKVPVDKWRRSAK